MRMSPCLVLAALLALAAPLSAQTIVSYEMQIYAAGVSPVTGTPLQVNSYAGAAAVCGQVAPAVSAIVVNPTSFFFDDPAAVGKVCIVPLVSTILPALPNGVGYQTTITATDDAAQVSPRSAASNPFNRQAGPLARTGLKVR